MRHYERSDSCLEKSTHFLLLIKYSLFSIPLQLKCNSSSADYIEQLEVQDRFLSDMRIMFNAAYVVDALKSYDGPVIDCYFGAKSSEPLILDDGAMKALLLPVRIADGK